jgi:hypothetical protein
MDNANSNIPGLTQREETFVRFVSHAALHAESDAAPIREAGFNDRQINEIRSAVDRLEQDLSKNNSTLSALLSRTLKSSCCR